MDNKKEIFISYKSDEFNDALYVKTTLENNGFSCWMAPMDIAGGSNYASEIPKAIENCKIFVLILSDKAQNSKWIPKEVDQAISADKHIMPFMIEDCMLNNEFCFYLSNIQRYNAYENMEESLKKLINDIKNKLGVTTTQIQTNLNTPKLTAEAVQTDINPTSDPVKICNNKTPKKQITPTKTRLTKVKSILLFSVVLVALIVVSIFIYKSITTITIGGTKYNVNDKIIHLENVAITKGDLHNINKMNKLTNISIKNSTFPTKDISVLSKPSISKLELINCDLTNKHIACLDFNNLQNLSNLVLRENTNLDKEIFEYLAPVSDSIFSLDISYTSINDLSNIPDFSYIYKLSANGCKIESLTGIEKLTTLQDLYIDNNKLSTLKQLSDCKKLQVISVNKNQLSNFKGLELCLRLENISADENILTSLEGLENTTVLKRVFLRSNRLEDISLLNKSCSTLEKLVINNNKITNLAQIKDCKNLRTLFADNNDIGYTNILSEFTALKEISLQSNNIFITPPFGKLNGVTYLDLSGNKLIDTRILENINFDKNAYLDLSNNDISNINIPVKSHFNTLSLHGNNINNIGCINNLSAIDVIFDYSENIDFTKIEKDNFLNINIVNCPKDKQLSIEKILSPEVNYITLDEADNLVKEYEDAFFH